MLIKKFNKIFIITVMSLFVLVSSGSQALGYGAPPAQSSANNYTVEIYSENESYNLGDTITFSGSVNKYDEDRNLRISIFDSDNNYILSQKTPVNSDGTFSHSVILNEKFSDGKFIVKAQYGSSKSTVEKRIRDIKRRTRKRYTTEEKIRIVLEGIKGESTIAELCRREGINENSYYRWR